MPPVLVLIHGFLENATMWRPLLPATEQYPVRFMPDLPGHGSNSNEFPPSLQKVSTQLWEEMLQQFPDNEFILIGHSMGGYIAAEIALSHPQKIKGLCFFHSTAQGDSVEKKANRQRAMDALAANKELYTGTMIRSLFANLDTPEMNDLVGELIHAAGKIRQSDIHHCLVAMRDRMDYQTKIKEAGFPVAYLLGDSDSRLPLSEMLPEINGLPHIKAKVLPNCGHMSQWEKPEEARVFLHEWLSGLLKN
jgi:pimeloyl-ACP methyl ester carboxylesterase